MTIPITKNHPGFTHSQSGFTLIECLLILAIVSAIIIIVLPLYGHTTTNLEIEQFFQQFEEDFLYAQQLAITESERLEIRFFTSERQYLIRYYTGGNVILRKLPEGMRVETYLDGNMLTINRRGNVSQGGTVAFRYEQSNEQKRKTFIFQVATGRIKPGP